jgi:hypothetical protein
MDDNGAKLAIALAEQVVELIRNNAGLVDELADVGILDFASELLEQARSDVANAGELIEQIIEHLIWTKADMAVLKKVMNLAKSLTTVERALDAAEATIEEMEE